MDHPHFDCESDCHESSINDHRLGYSECSTAEDICEDSLPPNIIVPDTLDPFDLGTEVQETQDPDLDLEIVPETPEYANLPDPPLGFIASLLAAQARGELPNVVGECSEPIPEQITEVVGPNAEPFSEEIKGLAGWSESLGEEIKGLDGWSESLGEEIKGVAGCSEAVPEEIGKWDYIDYDLPENASLFEMICSLSPRFRSQWPIVKAEWLASNPTP